MYFRLLEQQEETGSPCQDSPDLFFPEDYGRTLNDGRITDYEMITMAERLAKSLCKHCPLVIMCRDYAIASNQPYGIWGGLSPKDRSAN
jgi:WhiB family redox-sensing transcriptional regulator